MPALWIEPEIPPRGAARLPGRVAQEAGSGGIALPEGSAGGRQPSGEESPHLLLGRVAIDEGRAGNLWVQLPERRPLLPVQNPQRNPLLPLERQRERPEIGR